MRKDLPCCIPVQWTTGTTKSLFLKLMVMVYLLAGTFFITNGQVGTAPVNPPIGGFRIDGFVERQGAAGDWTTGPGGSAAGTYVFHPVTGAPLLPLSYHLVDLYSSGDDDQISSGKLFQNPNLEWVWVTQPVLAKDDMHNVGVLLTMDPSNGHIWVIISGDRRSNNGTSYLDFEFYQAPITKNNIPKQGGFGFTSLGPNGGRTIGDISITLSFTGGGSFANISYLKWTNVSETEFDYVDTVPPAGSAYAAANGGTINVPYGAFGGTTYEQFQFIEAAIDMTALIGGQTNPAECARLPFSTIFAKTKSSAERTADLKDIIEPLQVNACFDRTAPVFTSCPAGSNLGCNPSGIPAPNGAVASDNCQVLQITSSEGPISSNNCSRSQTRTYKATDACGNTATCQQTFTWTVDNAGPVITTGGTTTTLGCNPSAGDITGALGTASASDACGTATVTQSDGSVSSNSCGRSQTRTWIARDACGNTTSASRTVTWTADITPPVITTGGTTTTLGCNPSGGDINGALGTATATDACGATTVSSSDGSVSSNNCSRSQTRTFTARDACGNTATASRTVTWTADVTPPVITTGGTTTTLGCNPSAGDINGALGTATATDACGATTVSSSDGSVSSNSCSRSQTRTWTARDACGNTATASRTVTWTADVTPPVITTGGTTTTLGCNPSANDIGAALGTATATDACGTATLSQSDGSVSSNSCSRSQTRTFTARDACGNTATASRTVTWTADVTPPVITTGGTTTTLGCNPSAGDINAALGTATATDACGVPTLSSSDGSVSSTSCGRSQTRTWTARDACGNTSTASRTVSWTSDNTPPNITTGGTTTTLGCNPSAGDINGALGTASAGESCGAPTITPSDGTVSSNSCSRSQTRTWFAIDACGNTATASRTVTWTADVTPPVITTGGTTTTLGCNPSAGDINGALGTATATDACGATTVSSSDGTVSSNNCSRSQTRTFTARDACGNTSTASRTVTWTADVTPPVITTGGTTTTLGCNPSAGDINGALGTATATDACGATTVSSSDGSVSSNNCSRSQTRTFTARDACGNTATASRTVTWTADVTPPVITTGGPSTTLGCNPSANDIGAALGTATATDACGVATLSQSDGSVSSNSCSRSQTRTWTARDACGNTSTASRTVTWTADVTPPVFTNTPASADIDCGTPVPTATTPTASDACGTPTVSQTGTTDNATDCSTGFSRVVTRTWTARDACGNTSTTSQTIRVRCCAALCTYTQGYYGNDGGTSCDGTTGGYTTAELIALSLGNWGGTLTVGRTGHSIVMNNNATDIACIIDHLPGVTSPKELPAGNIGICSLPDGPLKNVLAGQTITLGLNLGITSPSQLASFTLQAGVLATQDLVGGCGSTTPETRICHYSLVAPYNLVSVENEYTYGNIDQAVIDAIVGTKNVAGLFALANDALANTDGVVGSENGATLGQINEALNTINVGFDKCKSFIGWNVAPCPAIDPTPGDGFARQAATPLEVTAFPNPYEEQNFSLRINAPVSGQATIEFFTIDGQKISEIKRTVVAKRDEVVNYKLPGLSKAKIVYTVRVGQYNAKGIVLSPN